LEDCIFRLKEYLYLTVLLPFRCLRIRRLLVSCANVITWVSFRLICLYNPIR